MTPLGSVNASAYAEFVPTELQILLTSFRSAAYSSVSDAERPHILLLRFYLPLLFLWEKRAGEDWA